MARSLKERYETQRVRLVQERAKRADAQLLAEQRAAQLLVEAMNEEDLNKVTAIIQKLTTLKAPELPKLTAAIEKAESEINKYTAGGPLTAAWTKMKSLVGIDNPIVKVTTFADALEKGFSQIPTILKNNGVNLQTADLNRSLTQVLATGKGEMPKSVGSKTGQKSDEELGNASYGGNSTFPDDPMGSEFPGAQNEADKPGNAEQKLKSIIAQLQKALSPGGIFGAFKKVPYISSAELAQELVAAPIRVFATVAKKVNAGAKAAEIAPDLKASITGAGDTQTKHVEKEDPVKKAAQSQPSQPAKDPTVTSPTTPTGEQTPKPPGTERGGGAETAETEPKPSVDYQAAAKKALPFFKYMKTNPKVGAVTRMLIDSGCDIDKLVSLIGNAGGEEAKKNVA